MSTTACPSGDLAALKVLLALLGVPALLAPAACVSNGNGPLEVPGLYGLVGHQFPSSSLTYNGVPLLRAAAELST